MQNAQMRSVLMAVGLMSMAGGAMAQGLVVRSTGPEGLTPNWQTFPGGLNDYANANRPYWDQKSMDGGNRNIGNYLTGSYTPGLPGGAVASPGISPRWFGFAGADNVTAPTAARNAAGPWGFDQTGTVGGVGARLMLEVAGLAAYNEIGWYDLSAAPGSETLNVIFRGSNAPPTSVTFAPSGNWGLYLRSFNGFAENSGYGNIYFTESNRSRRTTSTGSTPLDRNHQHFALFALDLTPGNQRYLVGAEDLPQGSTGIEGPGDYNDVVFTLGVGSNIPAPGAAALLGLAGVIGSRRRR